MDSTSGIPEETSSGARSSARLPLAWSSPFEGVWVARRDGRFAGMIQGMGAEGYKLTSDSGEHLGQYLALYEARDSLGDFW